MEDVDYISVGWNVYKYVDKIPKYFMELRKKYKDIIDEGSIEWQDRVLKRFHPEAYKKLIINKFEEHGFSKLPEIKFVDHHYSHALTAYYCSGYENAIVMTIDGHGEENCTVLWKVTRGKFERINEFNIPHSLGWYYAAFTKWLGFRVYNGEGKTMGLAPYGKPNKKFRKHVDNILKITEKGYEIDPSYISFGKKSVAKNFTDKFNESFGERPVDGNFNQDHKDIVFEAQDKLEKVAVHLINQLIDRTGIKNLCMAGGVALNCKMNGHIWRNCDLENIYIQPVSGDDGTAFGSAIAVYLENRGDQKNLKKLEHVYFGPGFTNDEIESALKKANLNYSKCDNIAKETAQHLVDGKVVGWFQGRMEVGPRALGNRSILADPRKSEMKDIVNKRVKFREPWRPFCPSILYERASDYLEKWCDSPFMINTFIIKDQKRDKVPAIMHVDYTVRPQLVKREINAKYYDLIEEFENLTGEGVVLNTSFNIKGEPIVCTPEETINCFVNTGIQVLSIGDFIVKK